MTQLRFFLVCLIFCLISCQKFETDNSETLSNWHASPFENQKVQLDLPTLLLHNESFQKANANLLNKGHEQLYDPGVSKVLLPKGMPIIYVIDNKCLLKAANVKINSQVNHMTLDEEAYTISLERTMTIAELSAEVESNLCIKGVSNDLPVEIFSIPSDPNFPSQKHLAAIQAASAFDVFYNSTSGIKTNVVMAVIDTGIDYNHQDLKDRMWRDSSGRFGYDFHNNDSDPMDDHFHGTHVAGIMGATFNNGIGISGVMGAGAKLMAVKVMSAQGQGYSGAVINGINYAVQNRAKVINISLGGFGKSAAWENALANAVNSGAVVVVAAGNSNQLLTDSNWQTPPSYGRQFNGMITVGSHDSISKAKSSFSNYGTQFVEIGTPGSNGIFSTLLRNTYGNLDGTSMASPVLAGAVGLAIGLIESRGYTAPGPASLEGLIWDSAPVQSILSNYFKGGKRLDLMTLATAIDNQYPSSQ
ncbi:MAG: S8 family serine peptidase, partial [Pseudomonadota bacterium]|nr:S8 family serine peptidase [Pseudomonadota bacterium]